VFALTAVMSWGATPAQADPTVLFDRWYRVMLQGQHVGWSHSHVVESNAGGPLTTTFEMRITVRRGPVAMSLATHSLFTESADGRPIEARSRQTFGQMQITQTMRFGPDAVELITRQGNIEQKKTLPHPRVPGQAGADKPNGGWLTPMASHRWVEQQLAAGKTQINYWSLDPSLGTDPIEIRMAMRGHEDIEVIGKTVPAVACDIAVSNLPGVISREYLDPKGWSVKSTASIMPGMTLCVIEADKQLATSKITPPEIMASTLIRPDRPIAQPRQLESAVYELSFTAGAEGDETHASLPSLPQGSVQRVQWRDERTARVHIQLNAPIDPKDRNNDDLPTEEHLAPSPALNCHDPRIRQLTANALGESEAASEDAAAHQAETLRRFVGQYIQTKDLSVGLATASEVARTGQGDCTEHAVLLAAMLRVAGIPSRIVSGLIYVDQFLNQLGIFGYHMWTQAWLADANGAQGRWVDLDATLQDRPFDAAHIALTTSAMSDATFMNDLVTMMPVIGRVTIKVIDTKTALTPTAIQK